MGKKKNEIDEILKASYRVELFIRKINKQIETALIYNPSSSIKKDIDVLHDFVEKQKLIIEDTRKSILTGDNVFNANYLKTDIRSTPLSTRTFICLKSADIKTVGELIDFKNKFGVDAFSKFRNLGKASYDEVIAYINAVESLQL